MKLRVSNVNFSITLAPDGEKIESAGIYLTVLDANRNRVVSTNLMLATNAAPLVWHQPIALDSSLPAGNYSLQTVLADANNAKETLAEAKTSFKILAPSSTQTIIDEDGTFLVNGKPFFPLGLYHVQPDDSKLRYVQGVSIRLHSSFFQPLQRSLIPLISGFFHPQQGFL